MGVCAYVKGIGVNAMGICANSNGMGVCANGNGMGVCAMGVCANGNGLRVIVNGSWPVVILCVLILTGRPRFLC